MTAPDRSAFTHFDHWLDAMVSGMPAPDTDAASDSSADPAISRDVRDAARQFHGLAARAERTSQDIATSTRLNAIWEDIMDAHATPSAIVTGHTAHGEAGSTHAPTGWIERSPFPVGRFQPVINGMLAAALILALATGLWRAGGGSNFGFGSGKDGKDASQFAALPSQAATPDSSARVDLPTADECTVEPLTVDRVMELVEDPYDLVEAQVTAEQQARLNPDATPPPPVISPSEYPSQEVMDEIAMVHRQVIACSLAESPFQVWALVDPELIQRDALAALPVFANENDVRAYLEQLQSGPTEKQALILGASYGVSYGLESGEDERIILMVDPNPQNSITLPTDETLDVVRVGALYCNRDGVVERTEPGVTDPATEGQTYFEYRYRAEQDRWVFFSGPGQG